MHAIYHIHLQRIFHVRNIIISDAYTLPISITITSVTKESNLCSNGMLPQVKKKVMYLRHCKDLLQKCVSLYEISYTFYHAPVRLFFASPKQYSSGCIEKGKGHNLSQFVLYGIYNVQTACIYLYFATY